MPHVKKLLNSLHHSKKSMDFRSSIIINYWIHPIHLSDNFTVYCDEQLFTIH